MKNILWTFIAIIAVVGIIFGSYQVYGMGYDSGEKSGYESGYTTGEDVGYQSGQRDGYQEGYQTGNDEGMTEGEKIGYTKGYDIGEQTGYKSGYDSGLATGTQVGYQDGYSKGESAGYEEGMADGLGHGYTIKDPTFAEVLAFLAGDKTDEKPYVDPTYVCAHFSRDVCNNAEVAGIRCAVVELRYKDGAHLIIAFNTIDRGLVYFEPQSDEQAMPAIGKRYYTTIIVKPGYYYVPPSYDDTIQDMVLIW